MKLLFIQDSGLSESIGLMDISAVLKANGHDCNLLIASEEKNLFKKIQEYNPDIIGFSCVTGMHRWVISVANQIKKKFNVLIIVGGPHATYYPEIIEEKPIDIISIGESVHAMLELLNNLEKKQDITEIKNLWVKKENKIYKNPVRSLIGDLDSLPLPDRGLYYDKYKFIRNMTMKRFISGIGCPYNCTFCHNPLLRELYKGKGKYVRKKSIERTILEIQEVKRKYPLKTVHFSDDTFTIDKEWLLKFLKEYKKRINLPFTCNVRIDLVDEEIAREMKKANCYAVTYGLESGNERMRNIIIKKELSDSTIIKNTRLLKKAGIKVLTTSIVGLPGETLENAFETITLNRKAGVDFTRINVLEPYPKLEIVSYSKAHGYLDKDFCLEAFDQTPQLSLIKSKWQKEFSNLCLFAHIGVRYPILMPLIKQLIKLPPNKIYAMLNKLTLIQEIKFFQLDFFPSFIYFLHTLKSIKWT